MEAKQRLLDAPAVSRVTAHVCAAAPLSVRNRGSMARKHKRPKAEWTRRAASLLGTVVMGALAIAGGSLIQARLSAAAPDAVIGLGAGRPASPSLAGVVVTITGPRTIVSEQTETLQVAVSAPGGEITETRVEWQSRPAGASSWNTVETLRLDSGGRASARVSPWKGTEYRAVVRGRAKSVVASAPFPVTTRPAGEPVVRPKGAAEPSVPAFADPALRPRAAGSGASPVVSQIPGPVWERMAGVSFDEDCPVRREDLRYVQVNYWGFDGYRYRGEIIVHASIAGQTEAIFTDLYRLRYPIRQMRLIDDFGKDPVKGADDYASMNADNTSGFNCRYVDGRESQRVLSPHAGGTAIDINPWENPFQAKTGIFPHPSYMERSRPHRAILDGPESPAVQAFESRGLRWGGRWHERDYHHFEMPDVAQQERK